MKKAMIRVLSLALVVAMALAVCATASALEYPAAAVKGSSNAYDLPARPVPMSLYTKSNGNNVYRLVFGDDPDSVIALGWNVDVVVKDRVATVDGSKQKRQVGGWAVTKGDVTAYYDRGGNVYRVVLKIADFDAFDTGIEGAVTYVTWDLVTGIPTVCTPLTASVWYISLVDVVYPDDAVIAEIYAEYKNNADKSLACAEIYVVYRNDDGRVYSVAYNAGGKYIRAYCNDNGTMYYWSEGINSTNTGWHAAWHYVSNRKQVYDSTLLTPAAFPLKRK